MRPVRQLRAITALLVALAACTPFGSSDEPASAPSDAGNAGADGSNDGAPPPVRGKPVQDAGHDAGPPTAKITFVNATVSLGPSGDLVPAGSTALRLCFKRGNTGALDDGFGSFPPLPHKIPVGSPAVVPGLFNGAGHVLPNPGVDLEPLFVQPYIMNAKSLAAKGIVGAGANVSCDKVLPPMGTTLVENVDYWKLPTIPANTFKAEKSFLLVASGCAGDAVNTENCGPGMPDAGAAPGLGNLAVTVFELDRTTEIAADSMGAQFFHASGPFNFDPGSALPIVPGLLDAADGDGEARLSGGTPVAYLNGTSLVPVKGLKPLITPNRYAVHLAFPLATVKELSGLTADYALGKAYTFVMVGDTKVAVQDANGIHFHGYHFLGFPNDPVIEGFKP